MKRAGLNFIYGHKASLGLAGVKRKRASLCCAGPNRKHNSIGPWCLRDRSLSYSPRASVAFAFAPKHCPALISHALGLNICSAARRVLHNCGSQFIDIGKQYISKNDVGPFLY